MWCCAVITSTPSVKGLKHHTKFTLFSLQLFLFVSDWQAAEIGKKDVAAAMVSFDPSLQSSVDKKGRTAEWCALLVKCCHRKFAVLLAHDLCWQDVLFIWNVQRLPFYYNKQCPGMFVPCMACTKGMAQVTDPQLSLKAPSLQDVP